jgi:hypothetical protein
MDPRGLVLHVGFSGHVGGLGLGGLGLGGLGLGGLGLGGLGLGGLGLCGLGLCGLDLSVGLDPSPPSVQYRRKSEETLATTTLTLKVSSLLHRHCT